jgi:hypothetical protein
VQDFLRAWGRQSAGRNPAVMLDQASVPWFAELNRSLDDALDDAGFRARLRDAARRLRSLATELMDRGTAEHPRLDGAALAAAIAGAGGPLREGEALLFPSAAELAPA